MRVLSALVVLGMAVPVVSAAGGPAPGAELAPGFERVLLADRRLIRARPLRQEGRNRILQREDGLLLLLPAAAIRAVYAAGEPLPAAPEGTPITRIFLRSGREERGVVAVSTSEGLLADLPEGRRFFADVRLVLGPPPPLVLEPPVVIPEPIGEPVPGVVELAGGGSLAGRILARNEDAVVLDADGMGKVAVLAAALGRVAPAPGAKLQPATHRDRWWVDPGASRALALPNGLLQRPGDLIVRHALAVTAVEFSPVAHLSLSLGSALPIFYAQEARPNVLASVKAGLSAGDLLHFALGVHGAASSGGSAAFLFAAATVGTADRQASLYLGPPLAGTSPITGVGDRVIALSGVWRLSAGFALATEHWLEPATRRPVWTGAAALRVLFRRICLDGGALWSTSRGKVYPWVGLGYGLALAQEVTP